VADIVDKKTRSRMMAGIGGKDTKPEMTLRRALYAAGFCYRLHDRKLPGRPDIVMRKRNVAIFVHGCFWHRHAGCRYATTPATRPEFWQEKFCQNVERDARNIEALRAAGWRVAVVWECGLKKEIMEPNLAELIAWIDDGSKDDLLSLPGD